MIELYAAAAAGIPIVSLSLSGKGYDFAAAEDFLLHLDTSLPAANPTATGVLEANDAPVLRVAHVLWACIPNIISVPLNSSGSENAIRAAVADLVKAMQRAKPIPAPHDEEAWLEDREARDGTALAEVIASSTIRGTQRGRMLEKVRRADELVAELAGCKVEFKASLDKKDAELADCKAEFKASLASLDKKDQRIEELTNKLMKMLG